MKEIIETNNPDQIELLEEHFDNIVKFFMQDDVGKAFPKPKKIGNNDWSKIQKEIESIYGPVNPLYGKCFHAAKFACHFGGGKKHFRIRLINTFEFCKEGYKTTHWFAEHRKTGKIFDPTAGQFVYPGYVYGVDEHMGDKWKNARNADFGFSWLNVNGHKYYFDEVAPSKLALKLGDMYEKQFGTQGGLYWWKDLKNFKR